MYLRIVSCLLDYRLFLQKPGNIGFDRENNIRIFDFGLAKELSEDIELENGLYKLTGFTGKQTLSHRRLYPFYGLKLNASLSFPSRKRKIHGPGSWP